MNNLTTVVVVAVATTVVFFTIFKLIRSSKWDTTRGVILESSIEKIYRVPSDTTPGGRFVEYNIILKYRFSVKDAAYFGDKLYASMPNVTNSTSDAANFSKIYAAGNEVMVYYNPKNPRESALIAGKEIPVKGFIIVGAFALLVAAIIVAVTFVINK